MKLLLVEDDQATATVLTDVLTAHCYTIDVAENGQVGLDFATTWEYDLVLLDLMVPKIDGITLCKELRSKGFQKPILLLTAKGAESDIVKGLDAGADDYVIKPYRLPELLARIRALLRRGDTALSSSQLTWEELCVDPVGATVTYRGQPVPFTPKQYALLGLFLRNPQRVLSRSEIIDRLWSIDDSPSEGAVTNLIKDLRRTLKSAGMANDLLETVYGLGYRLKAPSKTQLSSTAVQPDASQFQQKGDGDKLKNTDYSATVNQIFERYRTQFVARLEFLEASGNAYLMGNLSNEQRKIAADEAHRIAGALGSFGYGEKTDLLRSLEMVLNHYDVEDASQLLEAIRAFKLELKDSTTAPSPDEILSLQPDRDAGSVKAIAETTTDAQSAQATVLILNNDSVVLEIVKTLLQPWGIWVHTLANSTQVWETLATVQPNLLILDLETSELDGMELCQAVRQDSRWGNLPILVITKHPNSTEIQQIFASGADDFVHKPIVGPEMVTRVMIHLERSRLQQELETLKRRVGL